MQDLNDLFFFTEVVEWGGFSQAGRALRQPKSKLSRRVAQLEERLGVRLIERSSRRFRITEVGQAFYEHCRNVMAEVQRAEEAVAATQGEPHGLVRFSCPLGLMEVVSPLLADFLSRHPRVNLHVVATNRRVDLIHERIDVALRVRTALDTDAALILRTLARSRRILVASPSLVSRLGELRDVARLASWPTLGTSEDAGQEVWELVGPGEQTVSVRHEPRLACGDFGALREAASAGLGIAMLPEHTCASALRSGQLVQVLPDWHAPDGTVHLVYTSRRGLPPPVGALIDHLAERFRALSPLVSEP
ncbi:LysR family transcriptional regulator [Archangium gephyra]|nr:LysR family transcriptional regulator [Archangium gephyra]